MVTDKTLNSFNQIRTNFQSINAAFADNHVGLTADPKFSGMHSIVTMQPQSGVLAPVTTSSQIGLFNRLVSGQPNLFFAPGSSQTPIQLTYSSIKADSSADQYTFMAGPFIIYGGKITGLTNASQGQTKTLTPGSSLIYVDLTMANPGATYPALPLKSAVPTGISGTSFNISFQAYAGTATFDIYYFAIGLP